jgi:hypothetical protein
MKKITTITLIFVTMKVIAQDPGINAINESQGLMKSKNEISARLKISDNRKDNQIEYSGVTVNAYDNNAFIVRIKNKDNNSELFDFFIDKQRYKHINYQESGYTIDSGGIDDLEKLIWTQNKVLNTLKDWCNITKNEINTSSVIDRKMLGNIDCFVIELKFGGENDNSFIKSYWISSETKLIKMIEYKDINGNKIKSILIPSIYEVDKNAFFPKTIIERYYNSNTKQVDEEIKIIIDSPEIHLPVELFKYSTYQFISRLN